MSFNVGLPFMKMSFNPVSRQGNKKTAKTGHVGAVTAEFFDERHGRDKDIVHEETKNNVWLIANHTFKYEYAHKETGEIIEYEFQPNYLDQNKKNEIDTTKLQFINRDEYTSDEYLKDLQKMLDEHEQFRKSQGKKKMRCDVVCAFTGIVKVPMEIASQPDFDSIKFNQDSLDVLNKLFNDGEYRCGEINAAVVQRDEFIDYAARLKADHMHYSVIPWVWEIDENGNKYKSLNCKKFLNTKLFDIVNRNYPAMMREKGWDIKDCTMKEDLNLEEEKKAQKEKAKGKDAIQYKAAAEREKARLVQQIEEKNKQIDEQKTTITTLENEIKELKNEKTELQNTILEQRNLFEELQNSYKAVLKKAKKLVDAIKPLERLKAVLNVIWDFPRHFMELADKLAEEYELDDKQIDDLEEFYQTAKEADYTLDDMIELAKDIAEENDDFYIKMPGIDEPER